VKYWGVGNEIYGNWQIGHKNAADYAKVGLEFAKGMKWQDPSIKLVACGTGDPNWDRPVLESLVNHVEFISAHHYTVTEDQHDYYDVLGSVAQMEQTICNSALVAESISAQARKPTPVWTAMDEWNIINNWSDGSKRDEVHKYEIMYNLRDALWVASALNCIQRHCRTVRMANLAQLVNVIAPMAASPSGLLLTTIYYPLELYATRSGNVALDVMVQSPRFDTKSYADHPYLDVAATYDEAKQRVTLAVVNRRKEGDMTGSVELAGRRAIPGGRAFHITGTGPEAMNTFANPHSVVTQEVKIEAVGSRFQCQFPRHSITWLEFEVS